MSRFQRGLAPPPDPDASSHRHPEDGEAPTATLAYRQPDEGGAPSVTLGEVLGPLTVWAVTAVIAAHTGEALGHRLLGRIPADVVSGLPAAILLGSATAPVLAVALWAARQGDGASFRSRLGVVGVALVVLVMVPASTVRVLSTDVGLLPQLAARGGARQLDAVVVQEPRPIAIGWHVLVRVSSVEGTPTRERAAVTLDADVEPPPLGSRWEAYATARPLPDGGYGRWLNRQHAGVVLDIQRWEPAGSPGWLAAASEHVRARIRAAATRHLPDRVGGLLVGFVSGDIRLLPEGDLDALRATSLTHLTAVSGANVAIVVGGVLLLLGALRAGAAWRRRTIAVTVVAFAFLTRFEPSVLRAGSMALLVLLVGARGMPRDTRHALTGAVLLLVLLDPLLASSLGLLLSAIATAGVLLVAPLVAQRLRRLPRRLREVASVSIGAQVAVVPLLLTTFGEVPLASVPANILAVPAAALAAALSFVGSVLAVVHIDLGAPLFWLAGGPAHVVLAAAHGFEGVGGTAELARPVTVVALLGGCGWFLVPRGSRPARWLATAAALGVVAAMAPQLGGVLPTRDLTVTAIDVGQGDSFLIESPEVRILVDAGGDDAAVRWLRRSGRRHLDLVVVTHPHLDHVGGMPEVLRQMQVGAVWYRPPPTGLPEAAEVVEVAQGRDVPVRAPVDGEVMVLGDVLVEILHPPTGRPYRWSGSELNDTSIVLRVTHGDRRVLVTGDVEADAQHYLLTRASQQLPAELLLVPHHGAATTEPDFLATVAPQVALISAGRDNDYGHPHAQTLSVLDRLDVEVRRTDLEGTVRAHVPPRRSSGMPLRSSRRYEPLESAHDPPRASGLRDPGIHAPGRGIHGVLDIPQDGDADRHPTAVLAGRHRGDRHRHLPDDDGRRAGPRGPDDHPRTPGGPHLRRAHDRAVPDPLVIERTGQGRQGQRRPPTAIRVAAVDGAAGLQPADLPTGLHPAAGGLHPAARGLRRADAATERSVVSALDPAPGTAAIGSTVSVARAPQQRGRSRPGGRLPV